MHVIEVRQENHRVASIFLGGALTAAFQERRAGQFLSVQVPINDGWSSPHPFTISNAPEDGLLQITVKNVGPITLALHELKTGTELNCRGPFGSFCRGIEQKKEIVMIAGGIGITPFLSVLRHFVQVSHEGHLMLIWANNDTQDIFAQEELLGFTKKMDLHIIHVIANGHNGSNGAGPNCVFEEGLVSADLLDRHRLSKNADYFLCGSPAMQDYVLNQLETMGIDSKSVEKESFNKTRS